MSEEGALDIEQAVCLTGVTSQQIQEAARLGKIAGAAKDGKRWTFTRAGLRDWRLSRRQMFYHR